MGVLFKDLWVKKPNIMKTLCFSSITLYFETLKPVTFPAFPGNTLRGTFGWALKDACCLDSFNNQVPKSSSENLYRPHKVNNPQYCQNRCSSPDSCIYGFFFETAPMSYVTTTRLKNSVPRPWRLVVPTPCQIHFEQGDFISFRLITWGSFGPFAEALLSSLASPWQVRGPGQPGLIQFHHAIDDQTGIFLPSDDLGAWMKIGVCNLTRRILNIPVVDRCIVRSQSPLRLKRGAHILSRFNLYDFLVVIKRRLADLTECYGSEGKNLPSLSPEDLDEVRVISHQFSRQEVNRFSNRQNRKFAQDGQVGSMVLSGNLQKILPLLLAGTVIGIGKGTTSGFGNISVEFAV